MPMYSFVCPTCGRTVEEQRSARETDMPPYCATCNTDMNRTMKSPKKKGY